MISGASGVYLENKYTRLTSTQFTYASFITLFLTSVFIFIFNSPFEYIFFFTLLTLAIILNLFLLKKIILTPLFFCFFIPCYYITFISYNDVLCATLIITLTISILFSKNSFVELFKEISFLEKLIFSFFFFITLSTITQLNTHSMLNTIQVVSVCGVTYLLVKTSIKRFKDIENILKIVPLLMIPVGFVCIVQYFYGEIWFLEDFYTVKSKEFLIPYSSPKFARVAGLQGAGIIGACLYAMTLPFTIYLLANESRFTLKFLYFLSLILNIAALIVTFSRGTWLAALIGLLFLLLRNIRIFFIFLAFISFSFLSIQGTLFSPQIKQQMERASLQFIIQDPSFLHRLAMFESVYRMMNDTFIFGNISQETTALYKKYRSPLDPMYVAVIDNAYLYTFARYGFFSGLLFILILILLSAKILYIHFSSHDKQIKLFSACLFSSLLIFMINSLNFDSYKWPIIGFFSWFIIGIGLVFIKDSKKFITHTPHSSNRTIVAV
jgi:hypothetical protein